MCGLDFSIYNIISLPLIIYSFIYLFFNFLINFLDICHDVVLVTSTKWRFMRIYVVGNDGCSVTLLLAIRLLAHMRENYWMMSETLTF